MKKLAYRLIYLERPELLPETMRHSFDDRVTERLLADDLNVPWRTIPKALHEVDDLITSSAGDEKKEFYQEVRKFLEGRDREPGR